MTSGGAALPHHRDKVCVFHLTKDKGAGYAAYAVEVAEDAEEELLVGFHVGGIDLEQEVVIAGDVVAFSYLRDCLHRLHYPHPVLIAVLLHLDITEGDESAVHHVRVQHGGVACYESLALKAVHAREWGGGGKVYLGG